MRQVSYSSQEILLKFAPFLVTESGQCSGRQVVQSESTEQSIPGISLSGTGT